MFTFLKKDERIVLLAYKIEVERAKTLLGAYSSIAIGENKIRKLKKKIEKLGGNPDVRLTIKD